MKLFIIIFLSYAYLIIAVRSAKKTDSRDLSDDSKNPLLLLLVRKVNTLEAKQIQLQKLLNTNNTVGDGLAEKVSRLESKLDSVQAKLDRLQGLEPKQIELAEKLLNTKHTYNDELTEKVGRLESKLNSVQVKLDNFLGETSSHKLVMETTVTKLRYDVDSIKIRLNQSRVSNNQNDLGRCRSGWKTFAGHCYYVELVPETWENAKNLCERKAAYLVKIDNADENNWIFSNTPELVKWIGANDINLEGRFTWVSDNSTLRYSHWASREPNDSGGNEDCVLMYRRGSWNDENCDSKLPYICEE